MIITRKIQLNIYESDKEIRLDIWKKIRGLNNDVFEAANHIVNHQFFNDLYKERLSFAEIKKIEKDTKKYQKELKESKEAIDKNALKEKIESLKGQLKELRKNSKQQFIETFGCSEQNTTYQILSESYPQMSSYVSSALNQTIIKNFNEDLFKVKTGQQSLRSYKKGLPIPFTKECMRFGFSEGGKKILMKWIDGITFELFFGRDRSDNTTIIERVIKGEYSYASSSIQIKDNKLFLLFAVDIPVQKNTLNDQISVGVDLGINIPAYCALNEGLARFPIGTRDEFLKIRTQMQARRKRLQESLVSTNGGKGRVKKLKALERIKELESNFAKTFNHQASYKIIDFALKNQAAVIKLELLEGVGDEEKNKFILRNWSYFQLQKNIEYKAQKVGIRVVYIDPYHTSQTCSACGHYESGQREEQAVFKCKNEQCNSFGKGINADFNAARNIAKSNKIVTKKEECEIARIRLNH